MRIIVVWNKEVGFLKVDVPDNATADEQNEAAQRAVEEAQKRLRSKD